MRNIQSEMKVLTTKIRIIRKLQQKKNVTETKNGNLDEFIVHVINKNLNTLNDQQLNSSFGTVHCFDHLRKMDFVHFGKIQQFYKCTTCQKIKSQLRQCQGISISDYVSTAFEKRRH